MAGMDLETALSEAAAARHNFLTMQGTAAKLLERAKISEARVEDMERALRQIANISYANFGRQNEKLADIEPIARAALAKEDK